MKLCELTLHRNKPYQLLAALEQADWGIIAFHRAKRRAPEPESGEDADAPRQDRPAASDPGPRIRCFPVLARLREEKECDTVLETLHNVGIVVRPPEMGWQEFLNFVHGRMLAEKQVEDVVPIYKFGDGGEGVDQQQVLKRGVYMMAQDRSLSYVSRGLVMNTATHQFEFAPA